MIVLVSHYFVCGGQPVRHWFPRIALVPAYRTGCGAWVWVFYGGWIYRHGELMVSAITDGGQGWEPPHGKLNVKTGPPLTLYYGIWCLWVFTKLLLFCIFRKFFQVFSGDFGIHYRHPHPDSQSFLNFS